MQHAKHPTWTQPRATKACTQRCNLQPTTHIVMQCMLEGALRDALVQRKGRSGAHNNRALS
eukprot:9618027-Alexandrium_andersonii.AAC.1